ncbi:MULTISPECIES: site-specific integrase [Enterobacterales]|uniref:tyrosine-type recombinase/integrase n=1 Tax=Enterobacterales TaxID=91347 RepID=UPI00287E7CF6|nr:site-specific integrase [Serratia rubidaea]EJJ3882235.1 site-specific integrase [Salmonella enterica]EJJ3957256.1 site-specific integrase [Salmonella enterica]EJJ4408545.1 site-specific integrase [Salmonella enterica]EKC2509930.1 site-specific integrase [Salmonella enterica]EKC3255631.1 site-specific integrase [Salmonella enterica]
MQKKLLDALPFLAADPSACRWVCLQEDLLRAPNTIDAYARGVNDWLAFCHSVALTAAVAGRDTVALYVRSLHTGRQLAAATIRHRLTVVRLYNDWLCEEGIRERNPVRRGVWKNGGKGKAGIVPVQRRLPWIPDDAEWLRFLEVAGQADIRTRFMLALAYDCGLRREELCTVATGDIDPSQRLLTVRAEHTKNRFGRVVPYSPVTGELYTAWLTERRMLSSSRGPLFLSRSPRNRAEPISNWTWSKVVRGLALKADLPLISTHTFRHLCLTELARVGWDIHEIAAFAGHRRIQSTLLYIHLSARDLSSRFNCTVASLHTCRLTVLQQQDPSP